jgi:hypothetical protein
MYTKSVCLWTMMTIDVTIILYYLITYNCINQIIRKFDFFFSAYFDYGFCVVIKYDVFFEKKN